ncbi:MAG TPA: nitronate monooxygenase [Pseudonocardia sp.]|jgi:enoyl-[acyl-carrier protein] reductase II|nr:nitronate monooxygenase [Pseudonocardia sp.]
MIRTRLSARLGMRYPIFSAGMGTVATPDLVVAVSDAGGLGVLGGVGYRPGELRDAIREIRRRTDRPFGVDLLLPRQLLTRDAAFLGAVETARESIPEDRRDEIGELATLLEPDTVRDQLAVVLDEAPPVFVSALGSPGDMVGELRERGVFVMSIVGSAAAACRCVRDGVQAIVAQGTEAGGHTGTVATTVLVPQVADAVDVPVVAAGGIADGRGLAAALCLGAEGVWVGTRFVASIEAVGHEAYKRVVVAAQPADAVISRAYSGKTLRTYRNSWVREWEQREPDAFPFQITHSAERLTTAFRLGDVEQGLAPIGQVVGLVADVQPAAQIVREMAEQAERVLAAAGGVAQPEIPVSGRDR